MASAEKDVEFNKLLSEKAGCLKEMLELTTAFVEGNKAGRGGAAVRNSKTVGNEEQGERGYSAYTGLIDKREALLDRVMDIDRRTDGLAFSVKAEPEGELKRDVKELTISFLEADKQAADIARGISSELSKSIKGINEGKTANQLYQNIDMLNTTRFDKSH